MKRGKKVQALKYLLVQIWIWTRHHLQIIFTMLNNSSNTSSHYIQDNFWDISFVMVGPSFTLISTTVCIIVLNTYLKNLHGYIKLLLNVLCVHNIISMLVALSLLMIMTIYKFQSLGKFNIEQLQFINFWKWHSFCCILRNVLIPKWS